MDQYCIYHDRLSSYNYAMVHSIFRIFYYRGIPSNVDTIFLCVAIYIPHNDEVQPNHYVTIWRLGSSEKANENMLSMTTLF
ncbi:MAG: hypothetical protein ACI90V_009024 [Bacillariaceae sp.]|jgi:hypothetical protein